MGKLGLLGLLVACAVGGGIFANSVSKKSRAECATQCPQSSEALRVHFNQPPVEFVLCNCPSEAKYIGLSEEATFED